MSDPRAGLADDAAPTADDLHERMDHERLRLRILTWPTRYWASGSGRSSSRDPWLTATRSSLMRSRFGSASRRPGCTRSRSARGVRSRRRWRHPATPRPSPADDAVAHLSQPCPPGHGSTGFTPRVACSSKTNGFKAVGEPFDLITVAELISWMARHDPAAAGGKVTSQPVRASEVLAGRAGGRSFGARRMVGGRRCRHRRVTGGFSRQHPDRADPDARSPFRCRARRSCCRAQDCAVRHCLWVQRRWPRSRAHYAAARARDGTACRNGLSMLDTHLCLVTAEIPAEPPPERSSA